MNVLDSQWFFRLVEKCGKTPDERLVAVFDIVENLIEAPGIREKFLEKSSADSHCLYACEDLKTFLTALAGAAKANNPPLLTNQLVILLQGAIAEELRNPGVRALQEATKAAQVVIAQACRQNTRQTAMRLSVGGLAVALVAAVIGWQVMERPGTQMHVPGNHLVMHHAPAAIATAVSPEEIEETLALHEQFERGICRAPHLAALSPGQTTAYMNVIEFRTPENPAADRENLRAFLSWYDKVRARECYDPPVNGHTTVAWKTNKVVEHGFR